MGADPEEIEKNKQSLRLCLEKYNIAQDSTKKK